MKRIFAFFASALTVLTLFGAVPSGIGSICRKAVPMYNQPGTYPVDPTTVKNWTIDFKVVTLNSSEAGKGKSYAWVKTSDGSMPGGAEWAAQLRYWTTNGTGKTENNLLTKNSTLKEISGSTLNSYESKSGVSFFFDITGFSESDFFAYNFGSTNSEIADDEAPVVTNIAVTPGEVFADLVLTGSDNSGDLFYYIEDEANGIADFALSSSVRLSGLTSGKTYNLTVTPIDFNGNQGTPMNQSFTTVGFVNIVYGEAKDLRFKILSSATQLEVYVEPVSSEKFLHEVALGLNNGDVPEFELKPIVSADKKWAYIKSTDSRLHNKVLTFNLKYLLLNSIDQEPVWEEYVLDNRIVTGTEFNGKPIMHKMGSGLDTPESDKPVLISAQFGAQNNGVVPIRLDGSDNSGWFYFQITGGETTVHVFRSGDYSFTSLTPGKVYSLSVRAVDFSGNVSDNEVSTSLKTSNKRSDLLDGQVMGLNRNPVDNPIVIHFSELSTEGDYTVSMTVNDSRLPAPIQAYELNGARLEKLSGGNREFTVAEDKKTASYTFAEMKRGDVLDLRPVWLYNGGTFWADYYHVVGDMGGADVEAPVLSDPALSAGVLSWVPAQDWLSGVEKYVVAENGFDPVTIYDLNQELFSYTMQGSGNSISLTAYDFAGNQVSKNYTPTAVSSVSTEGIMVWVEDNQLHIEGASVASIELFTLAGELISTTAHTQTLRLPTSSPCLVRLITTDGTVCARRLIVR